MNSITVERGPIASHLTTCLNHPPLKFINPRPIGETCQVYASNYGGGLLEGDDIRMRVECGPGSRLYLGTQSSTKIYRSPGGRASSQETIGTLRANALAVVCPDPVVPFAGSRFRQSQTWELHPDADLVLLDWIQSGREARGEVFAFASYESELRLLGPGGRPLLLERFRGDPTDGNPMACGRFGPFRSWLGVYLAGPRAARLGDDLVPALLALSGERLWVTAGKREGVAWVVRAMGIDRRDVQPVQDLLFPAISGPTWLGFNPWDRRW